MKKYTRFVLILSLVVCGYGVCPPRAEKAAPADYGHEAVEWQITPDVAEEIAEMRAKTQYRPHRTQTRVFVRTQLKYGLERDDYLHKWYDRPLMGDVTYQHADEKGHSINVESWKRMAELARICGHGFSAFTISSGREDILRRSVLPGYETEVLVETVIGGRVEDGFSNRFKLAMQRIEEALAAPNTFRIDGKLILTSYPAIRIDKLETYKKIKEELVRRWGDKVALMPYFSPFPLETRRVFDKKELELVKENLRTALRAIDGLCFSLETVINHNRRTNPRFAVEVAAPIIHSVLSEPEFKDKFFGMTVSCGHENCYRWNYAKDCTGTRRLRDNYEAVLVMKPDFINATEWDEENENTHHRPTIAQGFVQQRLLRHATRTLNGEAQEPFPGDDTSLPNLVVSYRKALLAGEPIEVEVLNIPDGTFAWKDQAGAIVKSYPPRRLSADELTAAWFVTDVTELLDHPILKPELTVWFDGQVKTLSEGFWPLSLHANRTLDFRWVKQAIREKTACVKSDLKVSAPFADGTREVTGFVESPTALRSVEVLDGPDTIYLFDRVSEPPASYAFQDMVADTIHAMDALHLRDACAMGVSAGGMVAQAIMAERPELVRCVVIGSSTSQMTDHARGILNGWSALAKAGKTAELNHSFASMVYTAAFYARYEEAILAALDGATEADLKRFAIFADALANFKLPESLRGTAPPVLAIGAEEDRIFGPEAAMEIARRNDGRFFIYKGYGHAVYDEAPDYLQKVWEFFEEN